MPSLLRVLVVVGTVGALGYVAMYMLANYVDPKTREMSVTVPPDHFVKRQ
jgi:phage shock protein PspC (stress-responsive transcriptional regulator)